MAYVSLYRKYRSQTFDDVVGQDHVVKTLQNAIRLGKVGHAYLFCGTRGTGKTTTARLLAKALNCQNGPTPTPCNSCPACLSITEGSAVDIVELDAASHRGVGDIKEIRENVKFPPMELRYKVFIIDEAHQLSTDAKDAFLKTLEEPPAHAVFILATTEPQTIPITIRSRCQQFDFRRGSLRDIRGRLRHITDSEGVEIDDPALDLIASNADGSYRDSLSLLEQVLAYTEQHVTIDDVTTVLGTVTQDVLFHLADTIASSDEAEAFRAAAEVVESGKDIQQLFKSMAQHFRDLMFASVSRTGSADTDTLSRLRDQGGRFAKQALLRNIEIFTESERDARFSEQHRLLLELALLKAIQAGRQPALAQPAPAQPVAAPKAAPRPRTAPDILTEPSVQRPEPAPVQTAPRRQAQHSANTAPAPRPIEPPSAPVADQHASPEFDKIVAKWSQVLQHVKTISVPAYALLSEVTPGALRGTSLVLHFKHESHVGLFSRDDAKKRALQASIQRVFGVTGMTFVCEKLQDEPRQAQVSEPAAVPAHDFEETGQDGGQEILRDLLDIFPNAEIVDE